MMKNVLMKNVFICTLYLEGRFSPGVSSLILKSAFVSSGKFSGIEGMEDVEALEC